MRLNTYITNLMLGLCIGLLAACGNKGDLYPVPDELSGKNLELIEQVLGVDDVPAADAIEVDDHSISDESTQTDKGKTRINGQAAQQQ